MAWLMNPVILWLVVMVVMIIVEMLTLGLTTIWFAGGALIGMVAAAFGSPFWLQALLAVLVSAVLLFFTRPIAMKHFNKDREKTNAESLIGRQAIVLNEIDNLRGTGQVTVGGMEWSARSVMEGKTIESGAVVVIRGISGVKLLVEEVQNQA